MTTPKWLLCPGDVVDVLRTMPDASADACLSDVPYGLGTREPTVEDIIRYLRGERLDLGGDFMGKKWDIPPLAFWHELRRVLKPGAPIMIFGGTRTVDLIALGIRAAGFEIADSIGHTYDVLGAIEEFLSILDENQRRAFERAFASSPLMAWMHAQGFPKSLDIGKAIDRQREDRGAVLKVTAYIRSARDARGLSNEAIDTVFGTNGMAGHWTSAKSQPAVPTVEQWATLKEFLRFGDSMDAEVARLNERKGTPGEAFFERPVVGAADFPDFRTVRPVEATDTAPRRLVEATAAAQEESARWQGFGTALKPAWEPIVLAFVPLSGTYVRNVRKHGVGALNIEGGRIAGTVQVGAGSVGFGAGREDGYEYGHGREYTTLGRWPANAVFTHAEGCRRTGTKRVATGTAHRVNGGGNAFFGQIPKQPMENATYADADGLETVEAWDCAPGCPVAELDRQSGDRPGMSGGGVHRPDYPGGVFGTIDSADTARKDSGGASRFFFCAKADRSEREFGCEKLPPRKGSKAVGREEGSAGTKSPRAGAGRVAEEVRNFGPCVKPIKLLKHLATLMRPPARPDGEPRRILVPYAGTGSEMIGAMRAGWDVIVGIQRIADEDERGYLAIARARLERWSQVRPELDEDAAIAAGKVDGDEAERQPSLFEEHPHPDHAHPSAYLEAGEQTKTGT